MGEPSPAKRQRTDAAAPAAFDDTCHRYLTPEGCPYGDKCRYRHGDADTRDLNPGGDAKAKACTKFFSTSGCPYGEGCHFNHFIQGGIAALGISVSRPPPPQVNNPSSFAGRPSNLCRRLQQPGGCRFGSQCHFVHPGETTLAGPAPQGNWMDGPGGNVGGMGGYGGGYGGGGYGGPDGGPMFDHGRPGSEPAFGAMTTAKINIPSNMVGGILGKGGANIKYIQKQSGAKVVIRDHEADSNQRTVEMEGTLEQIEYSTRLVRQFLAEKAANMQASQTGGGGGRGAGRGGGGALGPHNYKTKLCDNFVQGTCTFGNRCHFAHGQSELREGGGVGAPAGL